MKIHDLKPAYGSVTKKRRVGRGIGGHGGKTAGRGTKGQNARSSVRPGFEGGQLPLTQRIPKLKGFKNPFKVTYQVVNLDDISRLNESTITPEILRNKGLVHSRGMVKVLGRGEISSALTLKVHAISASAQKEIEAKGGSVEIIPAPFGHGRPPVSGSALSNR